MFPLFIFSQEAENKALREEVNSLKEMFKEFMKSWQQ